MSKLGLIPSLPLGCSSGTEETNKAQMGKAIGLTGELLWITEQLHWQNF